MEMNDVGPNAQEDLGPIVEPEIARRRSRKRSITIFVVVSILNVALLALLWTQLLTPAHTQVSQQDDASLTGDMASSPLLGKAAPDFSLSPVEGNGKALHLSDFKGKPVVINFWASWCGPCNEETPFLQKSWSRLQAQGVTLIGIDGSEKPGDGAKFLQKYGVHYPNVQDTVDGATAISYGVTSFPETIFVNAHGVVVAKWLGALNEQGLQQELAKLNR
jgi:cytochrome c biogenesis protein CcmG/thiol:disulfide interchange protein DsbE